jgi:hypothetical protein
MMTLLVFLVNDYTPDEKELVKNLTKKKDFKDTP